MNNYETIFFIREDIAEEERNKVVRTIKTYLEKNGNVTKIKELGLKKLAYEVRKHNQAYYYMIEFNSKAEKIQELERIYRITDEILKFIVVRQND